MGNSSTPVWQNLALIALAGALGTLSRFLLAGWVQKVWDDKFPLGTLTVNCLGCFLFGMVWALTEQRWGLSREVRVVVLTGFMGAFTTFSTYAFEISTLAKDSEWSTAFASFAIHTILGIALMLLGLSFGRWL